MITELLYKEIKTEYFTGKEKLHTDDDIKKWTRRLKHDLMYCPEKRGFVKI